MQTLRLEVDNIKCNGCVNSIKSGLGALEGVDNVEVNLEQGIVDVSGNLLSRDDVVAFLNKLGYPVKAPTS